ncbi:MAG: aminotransferase class V-fold PLP-dependent enzyme [Armatimonadota bacterium]|nr:aminotransferase class V-fold PLP-dependent enzyme [Armatimonadota bacterium]MDR7403877.1 aminotransferase class V-fold PLP-dependent enzyme [Armatimonadota bacterium]
MDPQAPSPPPTWDAYRAEFPILRRTTYLNTCSLGALSLRVADAVQRFLREWHERGAASWYARWLPESDRLRTVVAGLVGADPDEVALFPSVSAALAAVASAFDYRDRPGVVASDLDFPTTVYQWLVRESEGVQVDVVRSPDRLTVPVDAYRRAVDRRTQLLVASHVYFTSGAIQDIAALAEVSHRQGALCLVDAYQAVGQLPIDVRAAGVDFLVTGGLKWLLGGPGIAFLYARREVAERLAPRSVGWFAHRDPFAFDVRTFTYAAGARRFEGGTPSVAAVYAARAGAQMVAEVGVERIRRRQVELVGLLVEEALRAGLRPRVPGEVENLAGIVTVPRENPSAVVAALARQGIVVDARPGIVRLSPYFYNTPDECAQVVRALSDLDRAGIR